MPVTALKNFLRLESSAGVLLVVATIVALLVSNSPLARLYEQLLDVPFTVALGDLGVNKPLLLWINDGLMAVFFFLIGLEVKREILEGQLSSRDQLILPATGALGGFILPAAIYAAFNWGNPATIDGWAIPAATDIAFALGVLMLLGNRVPIGLKMFLTSIAIFDDIGAIVVIAIFYTQDLSLFALIAGSVGVGSLVVLNRLGVTRISVYATIGIIVWLCVLKSGVHATLAGFAVACTVPLRTRDDGPSPLRQLEHSLHPWVAYMILPLFAFANAGVSFSGIDADALIGPVSMGIAVGLFVGKQLGVFGFVWLTVKLGLASLPHGSTWRSVYGVALLTGIGFTMSLFIGSLAFERGAFDHLAATRVGVLVGSILSATAGYLLLRRAFESQPHTVPAGAKEGITP
ncbi:MAG: Na+/H+ antiporter NhaA [Gammaproteobacteria bacterium]|nr:Na+/H+ antiporter NhaA [Gammaproteobacteria bacterium]